jgi:hypothetical protein
VGHLDPRHVGEELGAEVDAAAAAGGGIVDLAGLVLRERNELRQRLCRQRRIDEHDERARRDEADRRKILARVVADIGIEGRIDGERSGATEAERIAVGRRARHLPGRDRAAGAAAVLDHDLLAERRSHGIGDDARHGVVAAACGVGDDESDGAGREFLRVEPRRADAHQEHRDSEGLPGHHQIASLARHPHFKPTYARRSAFDTAPRLPTS